ncbi:MAG: tyrosine-type recombinase/integrase [Acidobacteriaceae bacterium]|nr:tyrosine-type recombinase/integrase [Acidobacteriaceae bacterium]
MKLQQGIERYVEQKRNAGINFKEGNERLALFCRCVGDIPLDKIRYEQVGGFLNDRHTSDGTWINKYNALRSFFLFWIARDQMRSLPMPPPRRPPERVFVSYIYSQTEVRLLLKSTRISQAHAFCRMDARTLRTILLFLYGTGTWAREAVRITREDVDLQHRLVTIRNSRLEPSRTIPFGPDLYKALKSYCNSHQRRNSSTQAFFHCKDDKPLTETHLITAFRRLRIRAGITDQDGVSQPPRLHDLRYTFAVHRLTAWHRRGADINRMLPALSVYMGYKNLSTAARFLSLTPERFRVQLNKLSPRQGKRHWRDDTALMHFLSTL